MRHTTLGVSLGILTALLASGCNHAPASGNDKIRLEATPDYGPLAGGTRVTLQAYGYELPAQPLITIGGEVAQVVARTGASSVVVITPSAKATGRVAVEIRGFDPSAETLSRPDVFEYLAPGQTPPASTTGGGSTSGGGSKSGGGSTSGGTTSGGTTSGGGTKTGGGGTTSGGGRFAFIDGTDKWWVAVDDPTISDADQDGTPDLEQVLQFAADDTGGQGAWSGELYPATDILMSYVAQYYLNNPDGSLAPGGVPISLQRTEPQQGSTPARGDTNRPRSSDDYNVMSLHHLGGTGGTTGRAITDSSGSNALLENDSGINGGTNNALGSFVDREVQFWNSGGISTSQRTLDTFMRLTAATVAHEIGHSLGLEHTSRSVRSPATANIMAAAAVVDPAEVFAFDDTQMRFLLQVMPGSGRCLHPAGWTLRWLVPQADAVVIGRAQALEEGQLTLAVQQVLTGSMQAGEPFQVDGFRQGQALSPAALAALGPCVWFLQANPEGGYRFVGAEAEVVPLAGRDPAEWTRLVRAYAALGDLRDLNAPERDLNAYLQVLGQALASPDARLRNGALVELSLDREAVRALPPALLEQVSAVAADPGAPADVRGLALEALTHRADPALADLLLEVGLGEDAPGLLQRAAGALEMSLGLEAAGRRVLAAASQADPAVQARARVLLGWLQCRAATGFVRAGLRAEPAQARTAADALGRIGDPAALEDLERLALDEEQDLLTRQHALRAIGRIGGADAVAWLSAQEAEAPAGLWRDACRFARDYPRSWIRFLEP